MTPGKDDELYDDIVLDPDEPLFTTGVVCRLLDIPIWVLKQLDQEGVVCPPRKKQRKARLYSKRELKQLKHAWFYMKEHHVNVGGLKIILKMEKGIMFKEKE